MRRTALVAVLMLTALSSACGGGGDDPVGVTDPDDEEANAVVVSDQGGSFSFMEGLVTLEVPRDAFANEVQIRVSTATASGLDGAVPDAVFSFEPDGLEFAEPVTLTLDYNVSKVPEGVVEGSLRLMDFTSGTGQLVLGSLLDVEAGTVSGQIHGFSSYGAGRASDEQLGDVLADMADAIEAQDLESLAAFDGFAAALQQDVEFLGPRIEAECLATNVLAVKAAWLEQLVQIELVRDFLGLDGVRSIESLCGGLLGDATVVVEPEPDTLRPGDQVQLSATIRGPEGEELVGGVEWGVLPAEVAGVDQAGLITALARGTGNVIAVATDLPMIEGWVPVVVVVDLVIEVSPGEAILAAGETAVLDAVVREADGGGLVEDTYVQWTIADPTLFQPVFVGDEGIFNRRITLVAQRRGVSEITACVLGNASCVAVPLTAVFNVEGLWAFEETLEVDVDLPATEVCEVVGTVQITQQGAGYTGSSDETSTCTYDPGDGSAPEVVVVQQQGSLRNGSISVAGGFYHETYYQSEACRTSGAVTSSGLFGWATSVAGTTECLEVGDFYSVGPMSGYRP